MTCNKVMKSFHLQPAHVEPADQSFWLGWDGLVYIIDTENFALSAHNSVSKSP